MSSKKKKTVRASLRKNRGVRGTRTDWTREFEEHQFEEKDADLTERVSGKGELTRKRTITGASVEADDEHGFEVLLDVDKTTALEGRVVSVHGLTSKVEAADGRTYQCVIRRLLKSLSTDQRNVVATGDQVWIRTAGGDEAMIERVEPRYGVLSRTSRGRQHVIVANVDQLIIVASAAEPYLKPNLIDRFLVSADKSRIRPLICINKVDLVEPASLQPLAGVYGRMGYDLLLVSAQTGQGIDRLRRAMTNRQSVFAGQSGVGKSSLLNAADPRLRLRTSEVSADTQKGRHTTTTATLLRLADGGYVVDTPGIRQFQLWDVIPAEVAGYYRDLRPFVSRCRFPDCTHRHEDDCAVKDAVAEGWLDVRRYESYCHLFEGDLA